ncbi:MAG: DUF3365 domain-containing protein [Dissulfurispiraceae bacterium]|nr:DUF3365 domain-containing protein [Dissulfurispiraceae bacterium]
MQRFKFFAVLLIVCSMVMFVSLQTPSAGPKEEGVAKAITDYLIAARGVIAGNQVLINDASKGDKGFTPEVFESKVADGLKANGIDLKGANAGDPVGKALIDVNTAAKEVVADAQPVINEKGKAFKAFTPAIFGARTGDKFYKMTGIRLKQTSIKYRGDYNRPDEFEEAYLKKFEAADWQKGKSIVEETKLGGRSVVRSMTPLYIAKSCLPCHGDPKGEIDISGRVKEGYKEGELRGAISTVVPIR